jgi:hypothetical protein
MDLKILDDILIFTWQMEESKIIKRWYEKLTTSELHPIPEKGRVEKSTKQGVYIIYDINYCVLHVGRTNGGKNGIDQRILNHIRNQSSFSKLYMRPNGISLRNSSQFRFIEIDDPRIRSLLEALAIGLLCPLHIGTGVKNSL